MSPEDRYIPIEDLPKEMIPPISRLVANKAKVRVKDCLLEVVSINDRKQTVTFRVAGFFKTGMG